MQLERKEEMLKIISDKLEYLACKRMENIMANYKINNSSYCEELEEILRGLANARQGCLVITYLRSSIVTESHEFYFAFYGGEPFVEENPDGVMLDFKEIFQDIETDIKEIEKQLRRNFVRVLSSEIEEIRRSYTLRIYAESKKLFTQILRDITDKEGLKVCYGEYMGELLIDIGSV